MKKTLSIVVVAMLVLLLSMGTVNAAQDLKVALSSNANNSRVEQGGTVVVTLTLNGFKSGETGINAFGAVLDYDKTVFETVQATDFVMQNGWTGPTYNPANGMLTSTTGTFVTDNHEVLKLTLKVKANATLGTSVVTFKDVQVAGGDGDIMPADQELRLTITAPAAGNTVKPDTNNKVTPTNTETPTNTNKTMPNTGVEDYILPTIAVVAVVGIFAYVRYNRIDK